MILLYLLPWVFGMLMPEPYGRLFSTGVVASIEGILMFCLTGALIITDDEKKWQAVLLTIYCWLLYFILC